MKQTKTTTADTMRSVAARLMPVRFEFTHPTASTVCVAGTFNDWQPDCKELYSSGDGHWWKERFGSRYLRILLSGGRPLDSRSPRERKRVKPVWREELGPEGGPFAGSGSSRQRGTCANEKYKPIEMTEDSMTVSAGLKVD